MPVASKEKAIVTPKATGKKHKNPWIAYSTKYIPVWRDENPRDSYRRAQAAVAAMWAHADENPNNMETKLSKNTTRSK